HLRRPAAARQQLRRPAAACAHLRRHAASRASASVRPPRPAPPPPVRTLLCLRPSAASARPTRPLWSARSRRRLPQQGEARQHPPSPKPTPSSLATAWDQPLLVLVCNKASTPPAS
ncbi:hypothetical protein EJB05_02913, partial [Eragrostis curvula]